MDSSTPGFPVHHQLHELAQTHVHWVSDAIQPSHPVVPFSSCPQSFPASGFFPMSQLLALGGQSIRTSASYLPMKIQGWFPLGLIALISLLLKGLSRVFSSTTVQKHQFFGAQSSWWSNSHISTWLLEKPYFDYIYIYLAWCKDLLKNHQPSIPMTSVNRHPWLSKIQLEPFTLLLCSVIFCI